MYSPKYSVRCENDNFSLGFNSVTIFKSSLLKNKISSGSLTPDASKAMQVTLVVVYSKGKIFSGKGCTIPKVPSPEKKRKHEYSGRCLHIWSQTCSKEGLHRIIAASQNARLRYFRKKQDFLCLRLQNIDRAIID